MDQLLTLLTYFVVLSVAAERLTEIIKTSFLSKFNVKGSVYQGVAAIFGGVMAYGTPPPMGSIELPTWAAIIVTGLAVSGGSGFWNSILNTVNEFSKNIKQVAVKKD